MDSPFTSTLKDIYFTCIQNVFLKNDIKIIEVTKGKVLKKLNSPAKQFDTLH
jgi:hypothetical protein